MEAAMEEEVEEEEEKEEASGERTSLRIFKRLATGHGRIWSPFHPFRGRGWCRSQKSVGHKMRRERSKKKKIWVKEERRKK